MEEDKKVDDLVDTVDPERPGCRLGEITWTSFTSADVTFLMASLLIVTTFCSVRLGTIPNESMCATWVLTITRGDFWLVTSLVLMQKLRKTSNIAGRTQVFILPLALAGSFTATSTFRVSFESWVASTKTLSESKSDLKKRLIGSCLPLVWWRRISYMR